MPLPTATNEMLLIPPYDKALEMVGLESFLELEFL
jgi:hypothetical protein